VTAKQGGFKFSRTALVDGQRMAFGKDGAKDRVIPEKLIGRGKRG